MVESAREAEARKGWLSDARIKALKGESQRRVWSEKWPQHRNPGLRRQEGEKPCRCRGPEFGYFGFTAQAVQKPGFEVILP
jgi:hypothetical protein